MAAHTSDRPTPASSKGEQVLRWEKKANDLERLADRRDDRGDDGTDLRIISDIYRVCALELTQARF